MAQAAVGGAFGEDIRSLNIPAVDPVASLRDQVTDLIRTAILTGQMRPDVVYSAPALAAVFGVSPTPVREAMLELATERMVEVISRKGFKVIELSGEESDQIIDLRLLIEVPVVAQIARIWNEQCCGAFQRLQQAARDLRRLAGETDLMAYSEGERAFHLDLLALFGNRHVVATAAALHFRGRLNGLQRVAERGALTAHAQEHEQLLSLLLRREGQRASMVMHNHIAQMRSDKCSSLLTLGETARRC